MSRRRIKRKKSSKNMVYLFIFTLFIIGFIYFIRSDYFSIKNINVQGALKVNEEEVLNVSGIKIDDNIFAFSASKVQDKIKQISNVKNASVVRIYPSSVKIIVTERVPYMIIFSGGFYYSIDKEGQVLSKDAQAFNSTGVVVTGINGIALEQGSAFNFLSLAATQTAYEILDYLQNESLFDMVSEIYISPKGAYYIFTKKNNVIKFYSLTAFNANKEFVKLFFLNEDRPIMAEIVDGSNPVYKVIPQTKD